VPLMNEEKLAAMSRRLYNMSIDVSSITADLWRQGNAIKSAARDCDYEAVMWEYRILLNKADQLHDVLAKAHSDGKIGAGDVDKAKISLTDYQGDVFEDMAKALREKCGCK